MAAQKFNPTKLQPRRYLQYSQRNRLFRKAVFFMVIGLAVLFLVLRTPTTDNPKIAPGYVPVHESPTVKGDLSSVQVKKVPTMPVLLHSLPATVKVSSLNLPQYRGLSISQPQPSIDSASLQTERYGAFSSIPTTISPPPLNPSRYAVPSSFVARFTAPTWNPSHLSSLANFSSHITSPVLNPSHYSLTNITPRYIQPVQIPPTFIGR